MRTWARLAAISLALMTVLSVGTASASTDHGGKAPSRLDGIARRGVVRVCSTGDYRPFSYVDPTTGQWSGIDVDMAGDLAQRLGVQLKLVKTTWTTLADDFGRKCDLVMGGVSVTPDRATWAFFSDPYLRDGKTPLTRCENAPRFQTLDQIDQPGVQALINPGGTNERFADANLHQATIIRYPDNNTIFDQVVIGQADLMITDATEARWQAKQHPELCAVHPDQPFTLSEKAYMMPRGDVVLQEWVNQWLHAAQNDGTYTRFTMSWFS